MLFSFRGVSSFQLLRWWFLIDGCLRGNPFAVSASGKNIRGSVYRSASTLAAPRIVSLWREEVNNISCSPPATTNDM